MTVFLNDVDDYKRDIDVEAGYLRQTSILLQRLHDLPKEYVDEWLRNKFKKGGEFYVESPIADVNIRDVDTGDRINKRIPLRSILKLVRDKDLIISPSMTIYLPPHIKRSLLSQFIEELITRRAIVKGEMFAAQAEGNKPLARNKKNEQNSIKVVCNSLSGAHSSIFTFLYLKSAHSTLTSTCRSATSYGNANNEKVFGGRRHYWAPGIVVNNILATIDITDFDEFTKAMELYNWHYPTTAEVMEMVRRCTEHYYINEPANARIEKIVDKLKPIERAAFLYIGDMWHLRKYNEEFMKTYFDELLDTPNKPCPPAEIKHIENRTDGDLKAFVALLHPEIMGSRNVKKLKDADDKTDYHIVMNSANHVTETNNNYAPFIKNILTTENVPASIARLPEAVRFIALVSDTDSTMGTMQEWAQWYVGTTSGKKADAISDALVYIGAQNIAHLMARMSANIGVEKKKMFRYQMKNEYKYSSFAVTNKAKHYFASIVSQEGTLKSDPELEMKGVALRTSNIPPVIMNKFRAMVMDLLAIVTAGEKIALVPLLEEVATIEHGIVKAVHDGDCTYLKTGQVKGESSYSKPESSNFIYWEWWESTFGPKYGSSGEPSYRVVKLNVNLENKTSIKKWLAEMKDRDLASRIDEWHKKNPKRTFTQLLLPYNIVASKGIPKEILDAVNYRRVIFNSVEPYYHVLECLKMMFINKNKTKLVSDFYGEPVH